MRAVDQPKKGVSVFSEMARDVKVCILEHRGTIYFIVLALLVDHLLFKDVFRHRLQGIVEKIIGKVEEKVAQ